MTTINTATLHRESLNTDNVRNNDVVHGQGGYPALAVRGLAKSFGPKTVLSDVNFNIAQGESVALIGPSGEGKSVLIKVIAGLMDSDQGDVLIDGEPLGALGSEQRRRFYHRMAMVFQSGALFDSLPVWENISFAQLYGDPRSGYRRMKRKDARAQSIEYLQQVGLKSDVADQAVSSLSGGMQRRVCVARALMAKPQLMLIDEPTSGLDPSTSKMVGKLIHGVLMNSTITALTITHDIQTVVDVATRVLVLRRGSIFWSGSVQDMMHVDDEFIRSFFQRI